MSKITIGIGYLCTKDESFRIDLSVAVATVSSRLYLVSKFCASLGLVLLVLIKNNQRFGS